MSREQPPAASAFAPHAGANIVSQEGAWQRAWQEAGLHTPKMAASDKPPAYVLEMWPYPSGDLHMGHVRNYTLGDVFARFLRLCGKDVLHPMGWDALGLPAENQAIKEKVAPQVRTPANIARMRLQMQRLGLSYDWTREMGSFEPSYYRWNQWFFLQMYKRDLVYRRVSTVNFCPGCQTTIANEQVQDDGSCWRGHPGVVPKQIPEWAFRITAFAEELLAGLDTLTQWPDRVVSQQRHWIGKSIGAKLHFALVGAAKKASSPADADSIEIFTTRIDTVYGCTYLVLAPEHPLVKKITTPEQADAVAAFVQSMREQDAATRTAQTTTKVGVFTGSYATHPFTGDKLPVWLANFVLADYGTGAVMAVPAHDARDFAFAKTYDLPVRIAIQPTQGADEASAPASPPGAQPLAEAITGDGVLVDSAQFTGQTSADARIAISAHAAEKNIGEASVSWHLRDWGFSRQRYWGTPIPIVYCDACGTVPLPESALPVVLPDYADVSLTGEGGAPLAKLESFVQTKCPQCGGSAKREVDTMDTFVDSAWYFARFLRPGQTDGPVDADLAKQWLPVDLYVGGPEHAVMHLLYFRFFTRVMHQMGLVPCEEPVRRLLTQGMVNAPAFRCKSHGYIRIDDWSAGSAAPLCPQCDLPLSVAVEKMSKSKYNGVDPVSLLERFGADTARLYVLFAAPPEKDLEWSSAGVEGQYRFVTRLLRLGEALGPRVCEAAVCSSMAGLQGTDALLRQTLHRTLAKVTDELKGRNHFNTAIAALMELVNLLYAHNLQAQGQVDLGVGRELLQTLAQMLSPMAPHVAESLWAQSGAQGLCAASLWPQTDAKALVLHEVSIAVQVGGKLRGTLQLARDMPREELLAHARADERVARHLAGQTIVKEVLVPNRLVNFVVRPK